MSGLTSFLLGEREVVPVFLHAVPQGHPQVGLLARRHALPSLLNVGERRVRDGVARGGAAEGRGLRGGAQQGAGRRGAHHGGWVGRSGRGERGEMGPIESPVRVAGLSSSRRSGEGGFEMVVVGGEVIHNELFLGRVCLSVRLGSGGLMEGPLIGPPSPGAGPRFFILCSLLFRAHSASWTGPPRPPRKLAPTALQ